MLSDETVSETTGAWLIKLCAGGHDGFTLWVADDAADQVLASDGSVVLFSSPQLLGDFIASRRRTNLDEHPGFCSLRLNPDLRRVVLAAPSRDVDLDVAATLLSDDHAIPSMDQLGQLLDAIWMAGDMAASVSENAISESLREGTALGEVVDILTATVTMLGEGSAVHSDPEAAWHAIPPAARSTFAALVGQLGTRIAMDPQAIGVADQD